MKIHALFFINFVSLFSISNPAFSTPDRILTQSFTGSGGTVGTTNFEYCFPLTVSGIPENLLTNYYLESVCVDLDHPGLNNLGIKLISPAGPFSL